MRDKIYRFMQGRYGTDDFYKFLFWVALIGIVINWFFKSQLLSFAVTLILVYAMYRVLSKNHSARYAENQRYLQATAKIRYWFDQLKKLMEERKYHHIYTCPICRQKIRIPKHLLIMKKMRNPPKPLVWKSSMPPATR